MSVDRRVQCSQKELAEHLQTTERTTQRALRSLVQVGYVDVIEAGGRQPNIIVLAWDPTPSNEAPIQHEAPKPHGGSDPSNDDRVLALFMDLSKRHDELAARVGSLRWLLQNQIIETPHHAEHRGEILSAPPLPGTLSVPEPDFDGQLDSQDPDRDHLLKTTIRIMGKQGYELTTFDEVIAASGLAHTDIVGHYTSKLELCLDATRAVYWLIDRALDIEPSGNMVDDFSLMLEQYAYAWFHHENLVLFVINTFKVDDVVAIIADITATTTARLIRLYKAYKHLLNIDDGLDDIALEDEISSSLLGIVLTKALWHQVQIAEAQIDARTAVKRWLDGYRC